MDRIGAALERLEKTETDLELRLSKDKFGWYVSIHFVGETKIPGLCRTASLANALEKIAKYVETVKSVNWPDILE